MKQISNLLTTFDSSKLARVVNRYLSPLTPEFVQTNLIARVIISAQS